MKQIPLIAAIVSMLALSACAKITLAWTDLRPAGPEAAPEALGPFADQPAISTIAQWEAERAPALRAAFEKNVYGLMPDGYALDVLERAMIDDDAFGGAARLEEYKLQAEVAFNGDKASTAVFYMDVLTPVGKPDAPVILMETFCPRADTIPHPGVTMPDGFTGCGGDGFMSSVMTYVFGRYIATPPVDDILAAGYAIATIFPGEFAPDSEERGLAALKNMTNGAVAETERWGAIGAWGWGFSLMIDALESNGAAPRDYIAWGHSRYGKSALVAAAFDARIDGVIAHQSGTGGASLNRRKKGESVKAITKSYPHWFAPAYANYVGRLEDMPVDQHQLIALIAPRPVLLGNARRDVWSDPNGAFRAAMGADPVYELYGSEGLDQDRLDQWKPEADIAFWIRPGTHGVVEEDWPAFLEFLNAHFPADAAL